MGHVKRVLEFEIKHQVFFKLFRGNRMKAILVRCAVENCEYNSKHKMVQKWNKYYEQQYYL